MKNSIVFKVFLGFVVVLLILAAGILLLSFNSIKKHYKNTTAADLERISHVLNSKFSPLWKENNFADFDSIAKSLGKKSKVRITIITSAGIVLADSENDPNKMENHKSRDEVKQALEGKIGISQRYSTTLSTDMLYVAHPVTIDNNIVGVVRVSMHLSDINDLLNNLKTDIFYLTLIMILVSLIFAFFYTKRFTKPIKELVETSRKVADGDFDVRILLKNNDELKELADSFNEMTSKIKDLFTELSTQRNELNIITSSIQEGLLVLDCDGNVLLFNDSINNLFKINFIKNKPFWHSLRNKQLDSLFRKIINDKKNIIEEIEFNEMTLICSSTYVDSNKSIIFLLLDITEIRRLERIRKDFISNVSHELKTPLTAIKGFAETIEEEEKLKNNQHIEVILRHTNRMAKIVDDLLTLSGLENKKTLFLEEIDLKNLIEQVKIIFASKIKEKYLSMKVHYANDERTIRADRFKLEQLFINLIDNSVKYTESGDIRINISITENNCIIEISDSGIGIPKDDLSRIFERFYVVDKSRSRKLGGTGLGLSIVKHIVLMHNGEINVESDLGKGTTFRILIPAFSQIPNKSSN